MSHTPDGAVLAAPGIGLRSGPELDCIDIAEVSAVAQFIGGFYFAELITKNQFSFSWSS